MYPYVLGFWMGLKRQPGGKENTGGVQACMFYGGRVSFGVVFVARDLVRPTLLLWPEMIL